MTSEAPEPIGSRAESVMDFLFVGLIVGFVALSAALVRGCDKLPRKPQ
jgi:hypothetical protein